MSKKIIAILIAVMLVAVAMVACSAPAPAPAPSEAAPASEAPATDAPAVEGYKFGCIAYNMSDIWQEFRLLLRTLTSLQLKALATSLAM